MEKRLEQALDLEQARRRFANEECARFQQAQEREDAFNKNAKETGMTRLVKSSEIKNALVEGKTLYYYDGYGLYAFNYNKNAEGKRFNCAKNGEENDRFMSIMDVQMKAEDEDKYFWA